MSSFDSTIARLLAQRIVEAREELALNLVRGSAETRGDVSATAYEYSKAVAYIRALEDVLEWVKEIEDDLLGRGKKK